MKDTAVKNRHRLKRKKSQKLIEKLKLQWGLEEDLSDLDLATADGLDVLITRDTIIAFTPEGNVGSDETYITLRGVLLLKPTRAYVTVDMGAVKFLYNGADVMAPGIVDADPEIQVDDPVWVRDEKHLKPLAVGIALISGDEMRAKGSGKAIKTLHYISDPIWIKEL